MLLVERGVLGGLTFLIAFGLLAWSFFSRLVRSFGVMRASPLLFLGPVSLLAVVALTFVDCSLLRPDALLAICGFLALSASDIPERRKKGHEGKITEDGNGQ